MPNNQTMEGEQMKTAILVLMTMTLCLFLSGCPDRMCADNPVVCPDGLTEPPLPPGIYNCTPVNFLGISSECGGCPELSYLWHASKCVKRTTGEGTTGCEGECHPDIDCRKVIYVGGTGCLMVHNNADECSTTPCDYSRSPNSTNLPKS